MTRIDFDTVAQAEVEYAKRQANGENVAIGYSFEDQGAFIIVLEPEEATAIEQELDHTGADAEKEAGE